MTVVAMIYLHIAGEELNDTVLAHPADPSGEYQPHRDDIMYLCSTHWELLIRVVLMNHGNKMHRHLISTMPSIKG